MAFTSSSLRLLLAKLPSILSRPPHHPVCRALSATPRSQPFSASTRTFSHVFQECSKHQLARTGLSAHARMITSGFSPTVFVTNCLIHMYISCSNLRYAQNVFDLMPDRDTISWNALISGYVQNGSIETARYLFDEMPNRDVISWNTLISGYLQNQNAHESVGLFVQMGCSDVHPDHTTFAVVLKSCSTMEDYDLGIQIHGLVVKMGWNLDVVTGSALVDMYAKCRSLADSLHFFHGMPERNWVSWSAAIAGCAQNEQFIDGLVLFVEMQRQGIGVSQSVYASVFRSCAGLSSARAGSQFHGHAVKNNFSSDVVVGTAILDMYAKSDSLDDAMTVFQWLPTRSLQSWNAIVVGFARNDHGLEAVKLFQLMNRFGIGVNEISLSGAFSACAEVEGHFCGVQIHSLAIKTNFISNICVQNSVLDMYGKCGALAEACNIFKEMVQKDAVSWNAIITALEQNGQHEKTLMHFFQMLCCGMEPDEFTYGSVLKACGGLQSLDTGVKLHDRIIKSGLGLDSFVASALVDMYCKCGGMNEAEKLHNRIGAQSMVSWNAVISGFSLQKQSEEAQKFFFKMLNIGLEPDNFTYATVLDTCANLATISLGKQIHAQTIKQKLHNDVFISSTLVDMYAKCGDMHDSLLLFEKMDNRDFVSWNAMICGYAQHGLGLEALGMFGRMQAENVRPNHATLIAVLRACGHVGLLNEGMSYFDLMTNHYKLEPQLEHYSCMVDIIGRCKGIDEALKLINEMPFEADAVIWKTLLSVCKIRRNVEIAELAVNNLLMLEPEDPSAYVLLSNIYAEAGKWEEVLRTRRTMRQSRLKKEPGCSWIEVKNEMHSFLAGDEAHPRCSEIYGRLDELIEEMTMDGDTHELDFVDTDSYLDNQEWALAMGACMFS